MTTPTQPFIETSTAGLAVDRIPELTARQPGERPHRTWRVLHELLVALAQSAPLCDCPPDLLVGPNATVLWSTRRERSATYLSRSR